MKIAFSTLGCPDLSWEDIYSMAKDLGFDGIELRGIGNEISSHKARPFTDHEIDRTMMKLSSLDLEISCISTSCCLRNTESYLSTLEEGIAGIDLAARTGAGYVRILADLEPQCTEIPDESAVLGGLLRLSDYASDKGVAVLIETNGYYASSVHLNSLMEQVNRSNVGVLWDVHHPYRHMGEDPVETYARLGRWIRYVHIKDSLMESGRVRYKMLGDGDIPVAEALECLRKGQYMGYVSLEWVKRWSADIEDAYIVFPQFANYMKQYMPAKAAPVSDESGIRPPHPYQRDILVDITLAELIDKMADEYPEREAFVFPQFNRRYTYAQFKDAVETYARAFLSIGIKKGDHIAMWATNYPEWVLTMFTCAKIGAVLVTVNTSYKIHEAEYLIRQSDASTLILIDGYKDSNYVEIINQICPELCSSEPGRLVSERLPKLKNVVSIVSPIPGAYHWNDLEAFASKTSLQSVRTIQDSLDRHEVINMQYTSGTTGFPKGVMLTHYNIINNGKTIGDCMKFTTEDRLLICVPLFHCFGLVLAVMASFTHASAMVVLDYFQPAKVLDAIQKERCTAMHGVPTMFIACLENPEFPAYDLSSIRTGIMAGSPCPVKVMKDVVEKMNMNEITIVYGQTEASPGCTQTRTDDSLEKRVSTVGRALPGVECKVADPETGLELPTGKAGEFLARGYNVMKGYYNMPEATAAAIDADGWLHTGDLAVKDDEGYYKITGRIKDMIIRGGENIYPKEIEEFLYTHPEVRDVQVVGVPDKTYGEEILAVIILKDGSDLTESGVREYVKSHMSKHKTPKYIKFTDSFPMTASGKVQKYKIRDMAVEELNLKDAQAIETA
ncbi:MAG: AMP-binding protein [Saccharofermentanales bacterium]